MAEAAPRWLLPALGGFAIAGVVAALLWLLPQPPPEPEAEPEPETAIVAAPGPPASKPEAPEDLIEDDLIDNPPWTGDLEGMVERRLVRMLVVPNRTDYYLDGGEPKGQVAEYGRELERRLNRRFQPGARPIRVVFLPVLRDDLLPVLTLLRDGRGPPRVWRC